MARKSARKTPLVEKAKARQPSNESGRLPKAGAGRDADPPARAGGFPVVGIGASAGGLEAFTELLRALPADTGMAFVLVQHLHPDYKSALTAILTRETGMPVSEVTDGVTIEPNHVYVIPPNADLTLMHHKLHLEPRMAHQRTMPIDQFLRSVAADKGNRSIGVILSGTASDGVLGLKAIKGEGGITFAQDEATAKYDGMPSSALAAGVVDFVLPPDKIALELARIARHPYIAPMPAGAGSVAEPVSGDALDKIFLLLRTQTGQDFTYYKRSTIQRRLKRRMLLQKLDNMQDYVRYLHDDPTEVKLLFHDILINVTGFFRDPDAFAVLVEQAFPRMAKGPEQTPIRIWVPGCSTGEEAYSIAIALMEYLEQQAIARPIQIFGTDIDESAIEKARLGIYPENIVQDVSPERIQRFFSKVEDGYRVSKTVRDMCIFAVQSVIKDPPFSRIDLVSCRNLLIYLGSTLQKKVLTIFHYALQPQGLLFLGTAESIGGMADLFGTVDAKQKLYVKKSVVTPTVPFGLSVEASLVPVDASEPKGQAPRGADLERVADGLLMVQYVPASVVINQYMDILRFRGRTGPYMEPSPGQASFNLMKMARDGLVLDLNAAVREAGQTGAVARRSGIRLKEGGEVRYVNIEVSPIRAPGLAEQYYLIVFQDTPHQEAAPEEKSPEEADNLEVRRLQEELVATKQYLQSVIEQQETSNEELRSANEEIQSSNEELQSINEELETAKEELQSSNEELATVNDELASRAQELEQANSDLSNLISSMDIPIVIVGPNLNVRRFTPQAAKLLKLIAADVGRPLSDINSEIVVPNIRERVIEVIDKITSVQCDVADSTGHWYSVWIHPYKTSDHRINGAVIAYIDIDRLKRSLMETRQAREYAEAIIAAIRHPLLVLDKHLRVVSASRAYMDVFEVTEKETLESLVYRLGNGQWAIPQLRAKLDSSVEDGTEFARFLVSHEFENIGAKTMSVSGRRIPTGSLEEPMVLMQIEDVSGQDEGH